MSVAVKASAIVVDGMRILITERHDRRLKGMILEPIGGPPKVGETMEHSVSRIVRSSLGIHVDVRRLLYVHEHLWKEGDTDKAEIGFYFLCRVRGGIEADQDGNVHTRDPKMHPKLLDLDLLDPTRLQPPFLKKALPRDMRTGFRDDVKHVVDDVRPK
jgi:ADP-ribose pyrophosphatase YjhB (NUDIX family)